MYGLPGMLNNFTVWKQWVGSMSTAWSGVLVGAGATAVVIWLIAWASISKESLQLWINNNFGLIWKAVIVIAVIGLIVWFPKSERAQIIWYHPDIPQSEYNRIKNECVTRAFNAIGSAPTPYSSIEYSIDRSKYVEACMMQQGFVRKRAE